jgi:hypothetical protein
LAMTGWPGSGATKMSPTIVVAHTDLPRMNSGITLADCGGVGRPEGGLGATEAAAGLRLLSQCRRCGGHIDSSMSASVAENLGDHPSRCSSSALRQQMCSRAATSVYAYVAPTWGIPPGAPAVHSDSGAVAVAGRSWGCARLARRPSSEGSRVHGAGPSVCGASRVCSLETHSGSIRAHCRISSGSCGENIGRKPRASGEASAPRSCCCDPANRAPEGQQKHDFFP